mgnify:CR=1 FL=1
MFSTGQLYFALFFVITFIIVMIFVYRKDVKDMKTQYRGTYWILITFLGFIALLALIKLFLKE